jgi:hypothetical protein
MDPGFIALFRLIQLTVGVLAGFGCIYFGYRLFFQVITTPSDFGRFKIPGLGEVNLKAAPGVFFALIGAFVIYVCVAREISLSPDYFRAGSTHREEHPQPY